MKNSKMILKNCKILILKLFWNFLILVFFQGLDTGSSGETNSSSPPRIPEMTLKEKKKQYRCSLINLDTSQGIIKYCSTPSQHLIKGNRKCLFKFTKKSISKEKQI